MDCEYIGSFVERVARMSMYKYEGGSTLVFGPIAAVLSTSKIRASVRLTCLSANKMTASSARVLEAVGPPTLTVLGGIGHVARLLLPPSAT